jgi:predicted RND superfamily exporter protein
VARLARLSLRHPAAAVAVLVALTAALGAGIPRLETQAGYRTFLGAGHPVLRELDATVQRFGGGLPFAAVWSCAESSACASVFDRASLAMAHEVARALEATPGVRRVDGPATSPLLFPVFLELPEVRRLAPDGEPAADIAELAERARVDPMWAGQIVSPDGLSGALLVHLEGSDPAVGARALAALRARLAPYEADGFRFSLVGGPVEFVVAGGELARNAALIVPLMVAVVAMVLALLFRSWWEAAVTLASVGLAVVWSLGLMGWLGWPQNSLTQALPPLVLVIGVCDAMHLLASAAAHHSRAPGAGRSAREESLLAAAREVGDPCLLTTLTTAAGFASFSASGLESFVRFGCIAAVGVCAALLLCFTLLPVLAARIPARGLPAPHATARWERGLQGLVALAQRRARVLLGATLALCLLGAWGFARLRVDASFEDLYGEDSQVVRWVRDASSHLRAPETLEIALTPPPATPAFDPAALRVVEGVEGLAELEGLDAALSILTPMRELHRMVHGGPLPLDGSDPQGERARRMLRLLRFEDPQLVGFFLDENGGYRVSFQSQKLPQEALRRLLAEVRARVASLLPPGWSATVTGPLAVVGAMIDEIRATQLRSFALAGLLVLAIVTLHFRSLPVAGMAVVAALLPVLLTLGAMGLGGIPLDVGTAMVAAVLLGLAVDDSIHLLTAYRRQRAAGLDAQRAVGAAVRDVGRAVVTSSAALAAGFLVLALAPWRSLASFGCVAALAVAGALASTLVVLPALLTVLRRRPRVAGPGG